MLKYTKDKSNKGRWWHSIRSKFFNFTDRKFDREADGSRILEEFQSHPDSLFKNSWSRWLWLILMLMFLRIKQVQKFVVSPRIPVRILGADGLPGCLCSWGSRKSRSVTAAEFLKNSKTIRFLPFKNCDGNSVQNSWSRLNLAYLDAYEWHQKECW